MRIIVVGGHGQVGRPLVELLRSQGHDALAVSRRTGVDVLTGEGLGLALAGAEVVVDVLNTTEQDPEAATAYFRGTTERLLAAGQSTGVGHHVLLSVVGADRALGNGYYVGKVAQEDAVREADLPFSIVRATQFHELVPTIADWLTVDGVVHAARTLLQPIALADVVELLAEVAVGAPTGATTDLAGPAAYPLDALLRATLAATGDRREVRTVAGQSLGAETTDALVPLGGHRTGTIPYPHPPTT
ncbi:SDR family oxidoreductase [Desertihabitans aurantiacus]|uniref:SDR family oxidoreductase n=1 Tax=Desertihabitans aurantiacus TaxID=2282477 RepID=UPI000DF7DED0|nr:NAD(P)H-binding protein [Desertihabitans aurantiacus]